MAPDGVPSALLETEVGTGVGRLTRKHCIGGGRGGGWQLGLVHMETRRGMWWTT